MFKTKTFLSALAVIAISSAGFIGSAKASPSYGYDFGQIDFSQIDTSQLYSTDGGASSFGSVGTADAPSFTTGFDIGGFDVDATQSLDYDVLGGSNFNPYTTSTGSSSTGGYSGVYQSFGGSSAASAGSTTGGSASTNPYLSSAVDGITNGITQAGGQAVQSYLGSALGDMGIDFSSSSSQSNLGFGAAVSLPNGGLADSGNASSSFLSSVNGLDSIGGMTSLSSFYESFGTASFLDRLPGGAGGAISTALMYGASSIGDAAADAAGSFFEGLGDSFDMSSLGDFDLGFGDFDFGGLGDFSLDSIGLGDFDLGSLDFGGFDLSSLGVDLGGITDSLDFGSLLGGFDLGSMFDMSSLTNSITSSITDSISGAISGALGDVLGSFDIGGIVSGLFG